MKKWILATAVALFAFGAASAQEQGEWAIGPQIGIYTNTGAQGAVLGVGAVARYTFADHWRVQPAITAIFHKACSIDLSGDVQYLIKVTPGWTLFPQAGISFNDLGKFSTGIDLGIGTDFNLTQNWDLTAGAKWIVQTPNNRRNPILINIGALYKF